MAGKSYSDPVLPECSKKVSKPMKLPYSEGSIFLVPLRDGGYARGVVARSGEMGKVLLGYFFGPRLSSSTAVKVEDLNPSHALLKVRFGDLGLINGMWPIVGTMPRWKRADWPMPPFVRRDPLKKRKPFIVRYSDADPCRIEMERPIDHGAEMTSDSMYGYGALEIELTKLLK
jgi:hypothetical protein